MLAKTMRAHRPARPVARGRGSAVHLEAEQLTVFALPDASGVRQSVLVRVDGLGSSRHCEVFAGVAPQCRGLCRGESREGAVESVDYRRGPAREQGFDSRGVGPLTESGCPNVALAIPEAVAVDTVG